VRPVTPILLIAIAALASPLIAAQSAVAVPGRASVAAAAPSNSGGNLSIDQAVAQAQATGAAVPVPGSTTATSSVTANADGTVTLSQFAAPARKKVDGVWKPLDATLHRNPDGSISPAVTTGQLTFGAPGSARLATQGTGPSAFALDLPFTLPAPTLTGDTATYPNVLSGVDLVATADVQGGFSEVFVVKNAAAAANPTLTSLALTAPAGMSFSSDSGANITASDAGGNLVAAAPTPLMWDSAPPAGSVSTSTDPSTGQSIDTATGLAATSSTHEAGEGARVAQVTPTAHGRTLTLTPSQSLLTSASTVWPVYLDPTFTNPHIGGNNNSWATVRSDYPDTAYVKTTDPLRVGYQGWDSPYFTARSFIQFPLSKAFHGSTVISASVLIHELYAPSCTKTRVDLYHSGTISSSTTWNNQPAKGAFAGAATVAYGYNGSCPRNNVLFADARTDASPDLTAILQSGADNKWTKVAFGLKAHDESDKYAWKKFATTGGAAENVALNVVYDHTPNTPTTDKMSTNPTTRLSSACASTPTGMSTIGKGDVTFSVNGSDPDGGTIGLGYGLFKTSASGTQLAGTSSSSTAYMVTSGTTFNWRVDQSIFDNAAKDAAGNPQQTDFYWRIHIYDGYATSDWSPYCHFIYDPTTPGAPSIAYHSAFSQPSVGTPIAFDINPPAQPVNSTAAAPAAYQYSLNGAATQTVAASALTTISVTPTRIIANVLTVTAVSAGGNIGTQSAQVTFDATAPPAYADNDLNGDSKPDQLTTGAATGVPTPGLWLAKGTGTAGLFTTATTNIGAGGIAAANPTGSAADFNGGRAITGLFTGGTNHAATQDQLVYFADTGNAFILPGNGDGTLQSQVKPITHLENDAGNIPTQLVNAGNTSGQGLDFPDLLATASPDNTSLALYLLPNGSDAGLYDLTLQLTNTTPTGGTDWTNWKLASAQNTSTGTNLYLWNTTTKALYLWTSLTAVDNGDDTYSLSGNQYKVTSTWNPSNVNSLEAADLNTDGTTDLRVINTSGTATAYLITALPTATTLGATSTSTAIITTTPTQTLTW
jgi:hypothetical protein